MLGNKCKSIAGYALIGPALTMEGLKSVTTAGSDGEHFCWPATAAPHLPRIRPIGRTLGSQNVTIPSKGVEVPPDCGRGQTERLGQCGSGLGSSGQQRLRYPSGSAGQRTARCIDRLQFHNPIVS